MRFEHSDKLRVSRIEKVNGAPALTVDGRPIPMMAYQWEKNAVLYDDPSHDGGWMVENMAKAGVELYFTRFFINDPEKFDSYYDYFMEEMKVLTDKVPNALVMPWINICAYDEFAKKYPNDVIHFDDGSTDAWVSKRYTGVSQENYPRHTFASDAWKHEVGGMLREFITRLLSSEYADRIVGYFMFVLDQEFSYFFEFDSRVRCIDFSPAMKLAFRNYLIEKYRGDVRLLRKAWNDDAVTFETAGIPNLKQRTTGDFGYFRDPSKAMQVYDYVACHNDIAADRLMYLCKVCKEASDYKHVVGSFWGYLMNQDIQMGGQTQVKKVLDSPYVDFWSSPFSYENRCAGNFASMRMALQSLNKHGKLFFSENDTFVSDTKLVNLCAHCYPQQTVEEDTAVMLRDFVYPFCEGQMDGGSIGVQVLPNIKKTVCALRC